MSTPSTPNSSNEEEQMKALMKSIQPKQDETSVVAWLLQDLNSHKERIIKGLFIF